MKKVSQKKLRKKSSAQENLPMQMVQQNDVQARIVEIGSQKILVDADVADL